MASIASSCSKSSCDIAAGHNRSPVNDRQTTQCEMQNCGTNNIMASQVNEHEYSVKEDHGNSTNECGNEEVAQVVTKSEHPAAALDRNLSRIPDGGWGWVVVGSCFACAFVFGAMCTAFSIMYVEFVQLFDVSVSVAGWVGSIFISSGNILGIFFGVAIERYGSRVVCVTGSVIMCIGFVISSFATTIAQLYIFFGIVAGSGIGMCVISSLILVNRYFDRYRAIANSLAILGSSVGSFSAGPPVRFMLDVYALRGTILIIAGICLHLAIFGCLFRPLPRQPQAPQRRKVYMTNSKEACVENKGDEQVLKLTVECKQTDEVIVVEDGRGTKGKPINCLRQLGRVFVSSFDFTLLRRIPFLLYILSTFLLQIGMTTLVVHTPNRALWLGVEMHRVALLPTVLGAATFVSRFIFGFVANIQGVDRVLQIGVSVTLVAAIQMTIALATTFELMVVYACLQGAVSGVFYCTMSTAVVDINGVEHVTRSTTIWSLSTGLGTLLSVPFAGFLFDISKNYNIPFVITGVMQFIGGLLSITASLLIRRRRSK